MATFWIKMYGIYYYLCISIAGIYVLGQMFDAIVLQMCSFRGSQGRIYHFVNLPTQTSGQSQNTRIFVQPAET
jgi:hypothetical protein